MNMPALQLVDLQMNTPAILAHFQTNNGWRGVIHFRTAVAGLVNVGIGSDRVRVDLAGCRRIHRLSEGQLKTIAEGMNMENLKRNRTGPIKPLQGEGASTT